VLTPAVEPDFHPPAELPREDFYLVVSASAPYKRLDLALAACARLRRRLVVIGTGQDEARLRALAGPDAVFLGWQSDEVIRDHLRRCRALLFPGEEDFGIVPVEAMACGAPVIAFNRGGATETVLPSTGVLFADQTTDAVIGAVEQLERRAFDPRVARRQAVRFAAERFREQLFAFLDRVLTGDRAAPLRTAA